MLIPIAVDRFTFFFGVGSNSAVLGKHIDVACRVPYISVIWHQCGPGIFVILMLSSAKALLNHTGLPDGAKQGFVFCGTMS